jgi:predicted pyridoxine 5'-phosphate oxidase superfamily flavin-nucleotide-binding protein
MSVRAEFPFHEGEIALQMRAGSREQLAKYGGRIIRRSMPDQHRELFEKLPMILAGTIDRDGRPWASVLTARPGFIRTPDEYTLQIDAVPAFADPLQVNVTIGSPIGLLGIELSTRRRNRVNGTVTAVRGDGFDVHVEQSFGNCPQYVQARTPTFTATPESVALPRPVPTEGRLLSSRARALLERADTFFIASAAPHARGNDEVHGCDVSHRGGNPGFIRVAERDGQTTLYVPDFRGNFFFNTLGNLVANPRAGLLFTDFDTGSVLTLTGTAEVIWDGPIVEAFPGAERMLALRPVEGRWLEHALPMRWTAPERARQLESLGP